MIYFNNPQCGELVFGDLDNEFHFRSLKGICESSSNGEIMLLEHTKLGQAFESHFATTDSFTVASEKSRGYRSQMYD